jgi:hypothetical protein
MAVAFRIPGTSQTPELRFDANPTYALYHWLRAGGSRHAGDERLRPAFVLVGRSMDQRGVRGMIGPWEDALASGDTVDQSLQAFQARVRATGDDMATAMRIAERIFMEEHWPARKTRIGRALETARDVLAPVFPAMAKEHADLLGLEWPPAIAVHLVTDCSERGGAYSHPLTIDVTRHIGPTLCETVLHESTHVADVNGKQRGHRCLGDRLDAFLGEHGLSPQARFNAWHAVIFASSAAIVRRHISLDHEDYATAHNLYAYFGVPHVAEAWRAYAEDGRDEQRLRQALLDDVRASRNPAN